ncbi:MAG: tRNA pseudouridine(55) synthase TruB, partial [Ligilactobacillus ruminis]|nr:tRNA pseudouridine(55) synthase TruB [Ligilactobacillus ruminis]
DLGKELGVPAVMSDLTRLESGSFKLDEAYTLAQLEELKQNGRLEEALRPVDHALKMPERELTSAQWKIVKNGGFLLPENFSDLSATDGLQVALTYQNKCRCVYRYNEEKRRYQAEQMIDLT